MTENPDVKVFEKCQKDAEELIDKQIYQAEMTSYERHDLILRTAITLFIRQVRR